MTREIKLRGGQINLELGSSEIDRHELRDILNKILTLLCKTRHLARLAQSTNFTEGSIEKLSNYLNDQQRKVAFFKRNHNLLAILTPE